ncbi:hypothetical protein M378DRAFT_170597 [Amanita muscaria Koide BX008]|uniref:Uncharacterized protein n=1 Tax=Amanita muscaria (strain Koide BX008) TaxID=946122 RepID=A0A0C2S6R6_AMAMK|nr:hypothetical protein M378DRAFT_170597 [Amanita muscaria Koide BX008]
MDKCLETPSFQLPLSHAEKRTHKPYEYELFCTRKIAFQRSILGISRLPLAVSEKFLDNIVKYIYARVVADFYRSTAAAEGYRGVGKVGE